MEKDIFLEMNQSMMELSGFWSEEYKPTIIHSIEAKYKRDILQKWYISDIVMNGDKVLVKWSKRYKVLSEEEVNEKYGK